MEKLKIIKDSGSYSVKTDDMEYKFSWQIFDGKIEITILGEDSYFTDKLVQGFIENWLTFENSKMQGEYILYLINPVRDYKTYVFEIKYMKVNFKINNNNKINTVFFFSPILGDFYLSEHNYKSIYRNLRIGCFNYIEKEVATIKTPSGVEALLTICVSLLEFSKVETSFMFKTSKDSLFTFNDLDYLTTFMKNFISFISFNQNENISKIITTYQEERSEYFEMDEKFYTKTNICNIPKGFKIIFYNDIKKQFNILVNEIAQKKFLLNLLFPLRAEFIYSIDILRFTSFIDSELSKCKKNQYLKNIKRIRKEIKFDELYAILKNHKKKIKPPFEAEFDSATGVFKVFGSRLQTKIEFTLKRLTSYLYKFNDDQYPFDIQNVSKRIVKVRNYLGHGLKSTDSQWYGSDVLLCQTMSYMLILERLKFSKVKIIQILKKLYPSLLFKES